MDLFGWLASQWPGLTLAAAIGAAWVFITFVQTEKRQSKAGDERESASNGLKAHLELLEKQRNEARAQCEVLRTQLTKLELLEKQRNEARAQCEDLRTRLAELEPPARQTPTESQGAHQILRERFEHGSLRICELRPGIGALPTPGSAFLASLRHEGRALSVADRLALCDRAVKRAWEAALASSEPGWAECYDGLRPALRTVEQRLEAESRIDLELARAVMYFGFRAYAERAYARHAEMTSEPAALEDVFDDWVMLLARDFRKAVEAIS